MILEHQIKLIIPNNIEYLPIVNNAIVAMAQIMGFEKTDISKIEIGLEEAIVYIFKTSFSPGEETTFDVILKPQTTGLKIIIKEKGIPYDTNILNEYDPSKLKDTFSEKGLGIFLMQQFVDEVSFLNLGKEGKEIHLFKHINNQSVEELMSNEELVQAKDAISEEPLPKNSVEFIVRDILEKEAIEISKCAYSSYGYTYINEDIYFPDRIWGQNKTGELISLISLTNNGNIMGHIALEVEERDPLFPQLGMAFVMPRYRGQGCMNKMVQNLINKGVARGFTGIYAKGITTHPYSQKSLLKFNFKDTALLLSSGPGREYKGIIEGKTQRESVMILSLFLENVPDIHLFAPVKHRSIITKIYNNLGVGVKFDESTKSKTSENKHPIITVQTENVNQVAHIIVKQSGTSIVTEVTHSFRLLCLERFETIYLHLKMNDPLIIEHVPEFEKMQFFFAGIMPLAKGSGELILQYLNNCCMNYEKIKVASETAQEIKEYIGNLDPNRFI